MSEFLVLDAQGMRARLRAIANTPRYERPPHVIGQTRVLAEAALEGTPFPDGTTVTFYDEEADDAYCLCEFRGGELVVVAKTFGNLLTDPDDVPTA